MKILKKDKHNRLLMLVSVLLAVLLVTACTTAAEITPVLPEPESSSSEAEATPTPTPPPAVETIVQPLLNEEPTKPVQDLFNKNGVYGFGGLQIGMSWENAKPIIAELTGNENPALPETYGYQTYIAFPYSVFDYEGTVTVVFTENSKQISNIIWSLPVEKGSGDKAIINRNIFKKLQEQLGTASESDGYIDTWNMSVCSFSLCSLPIGNQTKAAVKLKTEESVRIEITPDYSVENAAASAVDTYSDTESENDVYYEEFVRFPIHSKGDVYTALEFIDIEIYELEKEKDQIAQLLDTWDQENQ